MLNYLKWTKIIAQKLAYIRNYAYLCNRKIKDGRCNNLKYNLRHTLKKNVKES